MSETREIGGEVHHARKVVRSVRVELEGIADQIADLSDELSGLELEVTYTGERLNSLAEAEAKFDAKARDTLLAERRDLRVRIRALNSQILDLQSQAIGMRLDPQRDAEWVDKHVETDEMMEILTWLSDRPTVLSASESAPS
jgi:chromosome segregation ATPase